jgi:hypothetical protein
MVDEIPKNIEYKHTRKNINTLIEDLIVGKLKGKKKVTIIINCRKNKR